jgi:ABC-2 type transport system permease protein
MESPRRRRTILAVVPVLFFTLFQLPNLWMNFGPGARGRQSRIRNLDGYATAHLVNVIAPPGWLAYGAEATTEARVLPALAAVLGMGLVGAFSLRRAYLTTLRLYRGEFDRAHRTAPRATPAASPGIATRRSNWLMEWQLPWVSPRASSVAVMSFRSSLRASETKTALLTPLIMLILFARMLSGQSGAMPELMRAVATSGLAAAVLIFGMIGPIGNQFGYDRAAFLAFVLGPAARRDILLGKNLALLPFAMGMMIVVVGLRQWFNPLRLDHFMAVLFQLVTMFLLFCLAGNLLSIVAPIALKPGSGMPAGHQGIRSFGPLLFMIGILVLLGLTLFPAGIEAVLVFMNRLVWFPAYLVFNVVQAVAVCWLYRRALDWEGELLQRREPRILEIVASRVE